MYIRISCFLFIYIFFFFAVFSGWLENITYTPTQQLEPQNANLKFVGLFLGHVVAAAAVAAGNEVEVAALPQKGDVATTSSERGKERVRDSESEFGFRFNLANVCCFIC